MLVNGPAWKALIEEEFGDGIMSAIDFDMMMERLVDVAVRRWQAFTGMTACLLGDGRSFDVVAAERLAALQSTNSTPAPAQTVESHRQEWPSGSNR